MAAASDHLVGSYGSSRPVVLEPNWLLVDAFCRATNERITGELTQTVNCYIIEVVHRQLDRLHAFVGRVPRARLHPAHVLPVLLAQLHLLDLEFLHVVLGGGRSSVRMADDFAL